MTEHQRRATFAVGAVTALIAAMLLVLYRRVGVGYDGFWDVFTARHELWEPFLRAVLDHPHPPLFFLLLKGVTALFGAHVLAYRAISIVSTLGSTVLLALLVRRTTGSTWLPPLAAATFGLSWATAELALEPRGYALAMLMTLAALVPFLALVEHGFDGGAPGSPGLGARAGFGALLTAGFLAHYYVGFVFAACALAPFVLAAADRDYRRHLTAGWRRRPWANALTFALPALIIAAFYRHIHGFGGGRLHHVPEFLFDPARETFLEFVGRTSVALAALFSPIAWTGARHTVLALAAAAVLALSASVLAVGWRRRTLTIGAATMVTMLLLLWAGLIIAALMGFYPYGGSMRHQYVLLPFVLFALVAAVHQLALLRPGKRGLALLAAGLLVAVSATNAAAWLRRPPLYPVHQFSAALSAFAEPLSRAPAVYVDQYNVVPLFARYHDWSWRLERRLGMRLDVWRIEKRGRVFHVCHDRRRWLLDFRVAALYESFAACLGATGAERLAVARIQQYRFSPGWPVETTPALAGDLAPGAGLETLSVVVRDADVYAEFRRGGQPSSSSR